MRTTKNLEMNSEKLLRGSLICKLMLLFPQLQMGTWLLQIVAVAENNGLKLPREFGLLLKQSLYFDRYLKLLAPDLDTLRDQRVSEAYGSRSSAGTVEKKVVIDAEVIE